MADDFGDEHLLFTEIFCPNTAGLVYDEHDVGFLSLAFWHKQYIHLNKTSNNKDPDLTLDLLLGFHLLFRGAQVWE